MVLSLVKQAKMLFIPELKDLFSSPLYFPISLYSVKQWPYQLKIEVENDIFYRVHVEIGFAEFWTKFRIIYSYLISRFRLWQTLWQRKETHQCKNIPKIYAVSIFSNHFRKCTWLKVLFTLFFIANVFDIRNTNCGETKTLDKIEKIGR